MATFGQFLRNLNLEAGLNLVALVQVMEHSQANVSRMGNNEGVAALSWLAAARRTPRIFRGTPCGWVSLDCGRYTNSSGGVRA